MESRDNINNIDNKNDNDFLKSVIKIQREIRSYVREYAHTTELFPMDCCHSGFVPLSLPECFNQTLRPRLERIIHELSVNKVIFKNVTHITTVENLQSIIADGYIKGNGILKMEGKKFAQNVLGPIDLLYGDKQTICFGPGHIDAEAFLAANKDNNLTKDAIKPNVCAIISEIKDFNAGLYNQFFKLVDFLTGSFDYLCKINEDITINIKRLQTSLLWQEDFLLKIELTFRGQSIKFSIKNPGEAIFYGNQIAINRFCLTRLFFMLAYNQDEPDYNDDLENLPLDIEFLNYLQELSDAEIKKILIIFTQALTIYSEYNFNGYLELNKINIKEIRFYDPVHSNNGFKLKLPSCDSVSYQQFLESFKNNKLDELKANFGAPLTETECVYIKKHDQHNEIKLLFVNGKKRGSLPLRAQCIHYLDGDFKSIEASVFESNEYIETRSHAYDQNFSISSKCTALENNLKK